MVRSKAKLLSYTDRDPGALHVGGLEAVWECVDSVMDGAKPNLKSIAEAVALVLEGDIALSTLACTELALSLRQAGHTYQIRTVSKNRLEEARVLLNNSARDAKLHQSRAFGYRICGFLDEGR